MMLIQHHKASEYRDRAIDQFDQLYADATDSVRVMAISMHPYIMGVPHRARYLREVYQYICKKKRVLDWRANSRPVPLGTEAPSRRSLLGNPSCNCGLMGAVLTPSEAICVLCCVPSAMLSTRPTSERGRSPRAASCRSAHHSEGGRQIAPASGAQVRCPAATVLTRCPDARAPC